MEKDLSISQGTQEAGPYSLAVTTKATVPFQIHGKPILDQIPEYLQPP